jgi:hypothetical protein
MGPKPAPSPKHPVEVGEGSSGGKERVSAGGSRLPVYVLRIYFPEIGYNEAKEANPTFKKA